MKQTALRRKTPLKRSFPFKGKPSSLRRTPLRVVGQSDAATLKQEIQDLVRDIVIVRDGGCLLRNVVIFDFPGCNGYAKDGHLILQADHLITRANSATYADTRLIVCVCQGHHGWKSVGGNARKKLYDDIVRSLLPPDRVALWDRCEQDSWRPSRKYQADWKLAIAALKAALAQVKGSPALKSRT